MGLMNGLFLTLISAIACLSLPKLLSLVLVRQTKGTASLAIVTTSEKTS
ncbi:MAG: hypothetical protein ICV78_16135 [Tolypothrix sp. Co-bin9]|nr:hypothetical protein [Tolypothrix sp. Co-bin9]